MASRGSPAPLDGHGLAPDEIELGRVVGVFGVRGEVRLHLHNRESDLLSRARRVVLVSPAGARLSARLSARPGSGKRVLGRIEGIDDPDAAATLDGWTVAIPASALPAPDQGEFYVAELEGLTVLCGGVEVGAVETVHATPGGDVLEVATAGGPRFVPMVQEFVLAVDLEAERLLLAPSALDEE